MFGLHVNIAQHGNGLKTGTAGYSGSKHGFGVGGNIRSTLHEGSYGT